MLVPPLAVRPHSSSAAQNPVVPSWIHGLVAVGSADNPKNRVSKTFEHLTVPAHSSSSGCLKFGRCEYLKNLFVMPSADFGPRNSFLRYSSFMKLVFALSNVLQHRPEGFWNNTVMTLACTSLFGHHWPLFV